MHHHDKLCASSTYACLHESSRWTMMTSEVMIIKQPNNCSQLCTAADRTNQESSTWQPIGQTDKPQEPASADPNEDIDQDSSQLQSWNDELTQRLNAAMGKLQPTLSRPPRRSRSRCQQMSTNA